MQAPGGPEEDTSSGFKYGGWQAGIPMDEMMGATLSAVMNAPFELLLGKTTYNIFASYWPTAKTDNEVAVPFNSTRKYVVSHTAFEPSWNNSVCITGDVVEQIKKLKEQDGPDLWIWGSGNLIQTLLKCVCGFIQSLLVMVKSFLQMEHMLRSFSLSNPKSPALVLSLEHMSQ